MPESTGSAAPNPVALSALGRSKTAPAKKSEKAAHHHHHHHHNHHSHDDHNSHKVGFMANLLHVLHIKELKPSMHDWAYEGPKGPKNWHKIEGLSVGTRQSPLNFTDQHLHFDRSQFVPDVHYRSHVHDAFKKRRGTRASLRRGPSLSFEGGADAAAAACCDGLKVAETSDDAGGGGATLIVDEDVVDPEHHFHPPSDRAPSTESFLPATKVPIANTGHSVQINMPASSDDQLASYGGYVTFKEKNYHLKQIHFHSPAEHTVRGHALRMEAHFVHANADGALLVIGMFIVPAEVYKKQPVTFLDNLISEIPRTKGEEAHMIGDFDLEQAAALIQSNPGFYVYDGSLTTPPLSENVQWIVGTAAFPMKRELIMAIESGMPKGNARPAFHDGKYPRQEGIANQSKPLETVEE